VPIGVAMPNRIPVVLVDGDIRAPHAGLTDSRGLTFGHVHFAWADVASIQMVARGTRFGRPTAFGATALVALPFGARLGLVFEFVEIVTSRGYRGIIRGRPGLLKESREWARRASLQARVPLRQASRTVPG
jgi:hypothetical protein